MNQVIKWMEETHIIKGYNRECVYDNPRGIYHLVSNGFADLMKKIDGKSQDEIETMLTSSELEWVQFAQENELIMWIPLSTYSSFERVPSGFETPNHISNAIIHFGRKFGQCLNLLEDLHCRHIELIVANFDELKLALQDNFTNSTFQGIDIEIKSKSCSVEELIDFLEGNTLIGNVQHPNVGEVVNFNNGVSRIIGTQEKDYFKPMLISNGAVFFESEKHNTFFNKKLYIDSEGKFSLYKDFMEIGNIDELDNRDIIKFINRDEVKSLWNSNKDQIDVCRDCEFKRMCFDNRLPKQRAGIKTTFYHEIECSYNPYISLWRWDEGFLSLSEVGVTSNKDSYSIDYVQLNEIRNDIWG